MTFTPLTLDLNEYGILSGQLYQPEVHSVGPVSYTHLTLPTTMWV